MKLAPGLIDEARIAAALDEEVDSPRKLLPTSPVLSALQNHREDVADWATALVTGNFFPASQEVVAVSKARHGVRPVAVWELPTWLLYRALSMRLTPALSLPIRTRKKWEDFEWSPLNVSGEYIVSADIASCYQLIDHSLLSQELLVQTGDGETVNVLMDVLRECSGQTYGLPQQSQASDLLAEAFLARLERALTRRGLLVARYSDDFRVNCDSWSDVVRAIEILSEETRKHGMVLNDSKVLTWSREKYRDHLEEAEALRAEIAEEAGLDLAELDMDAYFGSLIATEPDTEKVEVLTAGKVLERWVTVAGSGRIANGKHAEHRALLKLLPVALNVLSARSESERQTLEIGMELMRFEQTMTPNVCQYLLSRDDGAPVIESFDRLLHRRAYLTGWQTWWLQQPLARLPGFGSGKGAEGRVNWLRAAFQDAERSPVLRAHAAITLARHKQITVKDLMTVYDRSSPVVRPEVVAAIGLLKPNASVKQAVTGDSRLNSWVFDWAKQNA